MSAPPARRFDTHQHCCHRNQRLRQESCVPHGASLVCSAPRLRPNHKLPLPVRNRTNLRRDANQSPPNAMQLRTEREFCAWRTEAGTAAKGRISQSLWDFLCTLGAHVSDMSGTFRETENRAISTNGLVEPDGIEPTTSLMPGGLLSDCSSAIVCVAASAARSGALRSTRLLLVGTGMGAPRFAGRFRFVRFALWKI